VAFGIILAILVRVHELLPYYKNQDPGLSHLTIIILGQTLKVHGTIDSISHILAQDVVACLLEKDLVSSEDEDQCA
jgi:hypothetical protein